MAERERIRAAKAEAKAARLAGIAPSSLKTPEQLVAARIRHRLKKLRRVRVVAAVDGDRALCKRFGYSDRELALHIERQFTKGMTWDKARKGEIHIDHIIPTKAFDLSNPDEVRRCFALTNLRPMWAEDNVRKGGLRHTLL